MAEKSDRHSIVSGNGTGMEILRRRTLYLTQILHHLQSPAGEFIPRLIAKVGFIRLKKVFSRGGFGIVGNPQ